MIYELSYVTSFANVNRLGAETNCSRLTYTYADYENIYTDYFSVNFLKVIVNNVGKQHKMLKERSVIK